MIKDGVRKILGKRVAGVMVKNSANTPRAQVFLVFNDGTYYEFYSSVEISSGGSIDPGGRKEIIEYMGKTTSLIFEAWEELGTTERAINSNQERRGSAVLVRKMFDHTKKLIVVFKLIYKWVLNKSVTIYRFKGVSIIISMILWFTLKSIAPGRGVPYPTPRGPVGIAIWVVGIVWGGGMLVGSLWELAEGKIFKLISLIVDTINLIQITVLFLILIKKIIVSSF